MKELRIAALDIGGTKIKAGLFESGVLTARGETDTCPKEGAEALMRRAGDLLETLGDFDAVGVSTAGQVRDGVICYANDNLPGYTGTDVRGVLGGRFGVPCAVINDAYAAAVGEGSDGAAKGFADYLCLTYGTGVGGGVVLGGRPYTGSGGSAATALGALVTHPEAICAGDPYAGTYERCASATALVAAARGVEPSVTDGRALFARIGETALRQVLEAWMDEVAVGLVSLVHLYNVPCVVLGGGVLEQSIVMEGVERRVRAHLIPGFDQVRLVPAALGNAAGLYGARKMAEAMLP